ncbi:cyclic nucleotide-binding domain-containing protein [Streptomyces sp. NPDC086787]|uniref:cyclic nucleotide-binding domain-containing protein n=1 Tax=Streptomyces sp. NPDC086787 TaxID=3365759 RepID=UPI003805653D
MITARRPSMLQALPAEHRPQLMGIGREVSVPQGTRLFEEGTRADLFWIVRTGTVELDMRVPGRRPAVIDTLRPGELVGWSWLFAPHIWQLGAEAATPVRLHEFDAATVRALCREEPAFGGAVAQWVGDVLAHRLHSARQRLLDLYTPYGVAAGLV